MLTKPHSVLFYFTVESQAEFVRLAEEITQRFGIENPKVLEKLPIPLLEEDKVYFAQAMNQLRLGRRGMFLPAVLIKVDEEGTAVLERYVHGATGAVVNTREEFQALLANKETVNG